MIDTTLARATAVIQEGISAGLHIGAQLYVSLRGSVMADLAVGESRPGVPMGTDTIMLWLSAGKPITAAAIAQLWEAGRLDLDDPVAVHIPQFAENDKEDVTIRHILTHTAGLRMVASNWSRASWDQLIARICASPLEEGWAPGKMAAYNSATAWFILGEIVRRLTGEPLNEYARRQILLPSRMTDSWLAIPPDVYRAYGLRIGELQDTTKTPPRPHPNWDTEQAAAQCRPGANARGPIRELGRFYEMLLNRGVPLHPSAGLSPHRILSPQTIEAMTTRHRAGMLDHTFNTIIDWGLGFLLGPSGCGPDAVPYGYGELASPRTFGHGGAQCSGAYADPAEGLVVAYIFNGTPGEPRHQQRVHALNTAIYEDLGLHW